MTQDEINWGKECLAAGDSLEDIAEMSGRPLAQWRHRLGVLPALADRRRPLLQLLDTGLSYEAAAERLGCSRASVWLSVRDLREAGLPIPHRVRGRPSEARA